MEKTARYAKKTGVEPLRHHLLPRVTGIYHTIKETRHYIPYLYDVTIGYKPMTANEDPEKKYTLRRVFLRADGPDVHMHIRRYAVKDIPEDEAAFSVWLNTLYREKDELMIHFFKEGYFSKEGVVDLKSRRAVFYPFVPFLFPLCCFIAWLLYLQGLIDVPY
eukprot:TRINITY_DN2041_c0_g1_i1.p2 TRINITY_DN2041_c0_g1~~TRINITY_DN2041_c0_g1_i1.p2  ORF type:complete len:162 (+),score=34.67 TRINITY_DN2041_c0_g1_i1:1126-1611(+)